MSKIIAGMYELEKEIGAGGGGIVYLGKHMRLKKQIILKADKRSLSTKEDKLRREVDLLKNLSHTYIPQVYDFVQEDGIVYTVMDYIEGESMDKLLAEGNFPTQPQLIKWACQLLEALVYLHRQPPHGILHGDIKPANIMLKSNGDVCLIDFNIALALGEDGAVKVGFSRGYASPEHYGADYVSRNKAASTGKDVLDEESITSGTQTGENITESTQDEEWVTDETQVEGTIIDETQTEECLTSGRQVENTGSNSRVTEGKKGILLDVRSDIYSLGATLYHLISGVRPAQDARDIVPLEPDICSEAVSAILQKAMAPQPYDRYQTAEEMLTAFLQLPVRDKRAVRHKRRMIVSATILTGLFLSGGICTFIGLKQMENRQAALTLAEYSANALADGDISMAVSQALQAIPTEKNILEAPVTAQAQKALTDALGVYDLSDGFKAFNTIKLPSAPFDIAVSPEGSRLAVIYAYEVVVFNIERQEKLVTLPIQKSAMSDVIFINEDCIIYAGDNGITAYDLSNQKIMWTGEAATMLTVSADFTRVAAVNRDSDHAVIYNTSDGTKVCDCSFDGLHMSVAVNDTFADPKDNIFALNEDGSMLAVSFYNGGLTVFNLGQPDESLIIYDESDYYHFEGGFCKQYFVFSAKESSSATFAMIDTIKAIYVGGYDSQDAILVQTSQDEMYVANKNLLISLDPDSFNEMELAYTGNVNISAFSVGDRHILVTTDDGSFSFYDSGANLMSTETPNVNSDFVSLSGGYAVLGNRNESYLRLLKLENHNEAQLLEYDARYDHDEARVSQNDQTIMLFNYKHFCIYDESGEFLVQNILPNAENIYDQQFIRDEEASWLEVIWYDGTIRRYSAKDGELILETTGTLPEKSLYEEFYTDKYRIASLLHTAPKVYELKSNKLVTTLEEDAYLTYITQVGDYIITEYISTSGERYGLLLNSSLETLAYLPQLCDVIGDTLVFDDKSGNLRQCRLYSLQELISLGETYSLKN